MLKIKNNKNSKKKEILNMFNLTEILELNAGLRELDTFTDVIENEIRNASDRERTVDFANTILSCLSMQSAKVKQFIEIAEKLEQERQINEQAD